MNGPPHQDGQQQQDSVLSDQVDSTATAAVTSGHQYNHSSIPPIRVQSDTPCPPSTNTPSPGRSQVNGGPAAASVQLPALSSYGQVVTNGQDPDAGVEIKGRY